MSVDAEHLLINGFIYLFFICFALFQMDLWQKSTLECVRSRLNYFMPRKKSTYLHLSTLAEWLCRPNIACEHSNLDTQFQLW